ncbi:MAG TPA: hypothetical protein VN702_22970 [Acetobacteraceae bacterium]|nr:hypothetical protein [Acetobacteraceae bacterium]
MDGTLIGTIVPFGRPRDVGLTHYTVPIPAPILAKIDPTTLQLPVIVTLKTKPDVPLADAQVRIGDLRIKLVASNKTREGDPGSPR